MSYMAYSPQQLRRTGAPFAAKRDSLLFAYTNCYGPRAAAFDALAPHFKMDAPGKCKRNMRAPAISPNCGGLYRSGATVWSESECLLFHYKFYVAWENSVSTSYVTEKLWQGLASGAVPIYRGAPDIRSLLPHPDAAVLWDDFETVEELAAYMCVVFSCMHAWWKGLMRCSCRAAMCSKLAQTNETLYARHMAWKYADPMTWQIGFRRIVERSMLTFHCRWACWMGVTCRCVIDLGGPPPAS